jgi:hypothetical protein
MLSKSLKNYQLKDSWRETSCFSFPPLLVFACRGVGVPHTLREAKEKLK